MRQVTGIAEPIRGFLLLVIGAFVWLAGGSLAVARAGDDWPPISKEELALQEEPGARGAAAILLFREARTDDVQSFDAFYYRIKILSEEGKKYANIEIPYTKDRFRIDNIKARTIRPDGTVVNFNGQVFEKVVLKARGVKILTKTFALPDVQVGGIIEYKYRSRWDENMLYSTRWIVQHELFTRRASFALRPYTELSLFWMNSRLPNNAAAKEDKDHVIRLELENIPPFPEEEYSPPEDMLKMRVDFYYLESRDVKAEEFWKRVGKQWYQVTEEFIGKRGAIERVVRETISSDDSPETKLHKLYARAQRIRNLSAERSKTEKEEKREKLKDNENVEDVLKRGYGTGRQINWLFAAMARAAGFDAAVVLLSARNQYFFDSRLLEARQLNADVVLVRLGAGELYLDPGTPFSPFGLLSWVQTGVKGLRLDKQGGVFVNSPPPQSADALVERKADLQLDESGSSEGTVQVSYKGQEALQRRLGAVNEDAAERRKDLEEEMKGWLPSSASAELGEVVGWEASEEPLRATFKVRIPQLAAPTGRRLLLPMVVFATNKKHPFQHSDRVHPVYFSYPFQEVDDVTIRLPNGYKVEGLPSPRKHAQPFGSYEISRERQDGAMRLRRRLVMEKFYFPVDWYPAVRGFYSAVKAGDEEQAVLQTISTGQN